MNVTYLGHSGFLVETKKAYYLFDYIRGTLPKFSNEKPLYVFASHRHEDHFSPLIFEPEIAGQVERFILSNEILTHNKKTSGAWIAEYGEKILRVTERQDYELGTALVTTLHSTDVGVAFVVREKNGAVIYHAGDLNWWHWEGEPDPWNPAMEKAYKKEINTLKGQHFDVAFVPLDPRLGEAYSFGLAYFEQQVSADHIFPMHFWEDYGVIPRYLNDPAVGKKSQAIIHIIKQEDEQYEI